MSNVDVFTIGLDQIHDLQIRNRGYIVDFDATNTEVVWGSWLLVSIFASFGKASRFVFARDCESRSDALALAQLSEVACDPKNSVLKRGYYFEVWHVVDDSEVEWHEGEGPTPTPSIDEFEGEGASSPVYQRYELESYLGEFVDEYDVDAIEREVTKYDPIRGCLVWTVFGDDLSDVCARYEYPAESVDDIDPEPVDWFGEMGDTFDELDEGLQQCREAYEYVRALDEIF